MTFDRSKRGYVHGSGTSAPVVHAKSRKRVKAGKKAARKRSAGTRKAARARWRKR